MLSGLKERLLAPELFAEFARTYQEELTAAAREQGAAHERGARALADCNRRIAGVVQAIEDGLYSPALKGRMAELEGERARLAAQLEAAAPAPPVALAPEPARALPATVRAARGGAQDLRRLVADQGVVQRPHRERLGACNRLGA